jgi:hypothetical protein
MTHLVAWADLAERQLYGSRALSQFWLRLAACGGRAAVENLIKIVETDPTQSPCVIRLNCCAILFGKRCVSALIPNIGETP